MANTPLILLIIYTCTTFLLCSLAVHDQASALAAWKTATKKLVRSSSSSTTPDPHANNISTNHHHRRRRVHGHDKNVDRIVHGLPGQPKYDDDFDQYAGYVTVDARTGRSLFYYFAEATTAAASKPLILWLNGGPGCSSMVGALVEIGPFGVNPDRRSLYRREFAWNKAANTLFVESPAGVGFSYSNTSSDYRKSGDERTAEDAYTFLVNWFERFSDYRKNDLYIAGESYAGHYVPELADVILRQKMESDDHTAKINLKGIMIGNGVMNEATDDRGSIDFMWSHALISDDVHRQLINNGNCSSNDEQHCTYPAYDIGNLDLYDIYAPLCPVEDVGSTKLRLGYDPCESMYIASYLNLPEVQHVLHANTTKLPYKWEVCSELVGVNWDLEHTPSTMFPIYRRLISSGIRILLYSGDVDAIVPVTSTRYSISALGLKVKKPWIPWYADDSNEVAGYRELYEGLSFATIRGAGHMAPLSSPSRAFALLRKFLAADDI